MEFEVGQKAASHPERKGVTSIEADIDTGRYVVNFGSKEHWEIKTQNAIVKTELLF